MDKKEQLYITKEGLLKLKDELKDLIENKRTEVANRIKNAREMGDISENSEYDSAKQEQSYIEGKISELEEIIKTAKVNENTNKGVVDVGCKVTVHIEESEQTFHIVGAPEANPMENKISNISPLGAALLGKKVGDKLEIEVPAGKINYTVLKIEY